MAMIVTAPENYQTLSATDWRVFLAGAIDMGTAVDWQAWVIDELFAVEHLTVLNPRRANFTLDTLDEQIEWELAALEAVDTIFMWFPDNSKAPISFFEAGLYWRSGKLLIGADSGFYRRRNLELTGKRYGVYLYPSLRTMVQSLLNSIHKNRMPP